eukprot:CAMPEP_0176375014 /NCGR_PEP_ID=MMETSP0126-20121128/27205_1 /TAXON_ID=141414 ORGANISM="Strombidinopsis acuminatum, Strain SPMC142" /NCGR_SAMPLE_ID=MMETSP0126 /ASSEMBLY_ACC=CAM_ASM_000229 /LENGTH=73 /DNA_ID=CAMNT_0017735909 /DNA_START=389 /DNA_END=610 /DNA_ORIENTATION=-
MKFTQEMANDGVPNFKDYYEEGRKLPFLASMVPGGLSTEEDIENEFSVQSFDEETKSFVLKFEFKNPLSISAN